MPLNAHIGTSGFSYQHWQGVFYPPDIPSRNWLEYYSRQLSSLELNVSFYRLPSAAAFSGWYRRTPAGFSFAVKGSRLITHLKRLQEVEQPLKLFMERAHGLKEKLAVVLWQFPPKFELELERLKGFVRLLKQYSPLPQVFEFRHPSWLSPAVYDLLAQADMAICQADWPRFPQTIPCTAGYAYFRRHGAGAQLYSGCYSPEQLKQDAELIRNLQEQGKQVYIYFNNDAHGFAVQNAIHLRQLLIGRAT
jgi:uncharacterized protein YecE (DUF72 family)